MKKTNRIIYSIFSLALVINIIGLLWPLNQDEGVFLTIANQMHHGWLPYRDIFDHKTPGIYYFLSFLIKFTRSTLILRLIFFLINLSSSYIIFLIGRKIWTKEIGLFGALIYLLILPTYEGHLILTEIPMAFLLTLACYFFLVRKGKDGLISIFFSGISLSVAVFFKQPAILNFIILLTVLLLTEPKKISKLSALIMGFAIPILFLIAWLWQKNLLPDFFQQAIYLNFTSYPPSNMIVVFKKWFWLMFLTLPIWLLTFSSSISILKNRSQKELAIISLCLMPIPLLFYRYYPHYWLQVMPFVCLLSSKAVFDNKKNTNFYLVYILMFALISSGLFIKTGIEKNSQKSEQIKLAQAIRQSTKPSDQIYSSRFFTGVYFLANRPPTSRFLYISEVNKNLGAQNEVINNIRQKQPKFVVWLPEDSALEDPYSYYIGRVIPERYHKKQYFTKLDLLLHEINALQ